MRRIVATAPLVVLLLSLALPAAAWGPGGHAALAVGVADERGVEFPNGYLFLQAIYGATAPDFAWAAEDPLRTALGAATHDDPGYREPWDLSQPWSPVQRFFAGGWLTHNQAWGADHYAHLANPLDATLSGPGYVEGRASLLAASQGISQAAAHDYIEAAVDLLLDQTFSEAKLGELLFLAAYYRDRQVLRLVIRSYADVPGADAAAIAGLEQAFRTGLALYGIGLALPTGLDDFVFAVGLAAYHELTAARSLAVLAEAKTLCQASDAHYLNALVATSSLVAAGPWP